MANDKVVKLSGWAKGVISKRENPFDFPPDALVYGENVDLVDGCIKTRLGSYVVSAGSLPDGEVMALYQVRFPTNEITYLIAQVDTGTARNVYACSTALPSTTATFTKIYDLGATAGVITAAVLNDRVVITEGVAAVPLVFGGAMTASPTVTDWMYPKQVLCSVDGITFYDITGYVCDQDSSISAGIGSITMNGYLAICTDMPTVNGFYIEMDDVNTGVSGEFTETMSFDNVANYNREDLKGTIVNWVQDGTTAGHFTDVDDNAVTVGAEYVQSWAATPNANADFANYSIRAIVAAATSTVSGTTIRLTFSSLASVTDMVVDHVSIVERSGTTDDGTATPTEVLFSGASGFSLAPSSTIVSDPLTFTFDHTKDYLVIYDIAAVTGGASYKTSTGDGYYYKAASDTWNQQTVTSDGVSAGYVGSVTKIEVTSARTEADVIPGVMVKFADAETYIGTITGDGSGASGVDLKTAHVTAEVSAIYALENVSGQVGLTHYGTGETTASSWTSSGHTNDILAGGYSIRAIISAGTSTTSGTGVYVTFRGGVAGSFAVDHASIVERSGTTDDGTTTPTELKFSGLSGFSVGTGATIQSDLLVFNFDQTKDYLVIMDVAAGAQRAAYKSTGGDGFYQLETADSWDQQTVSGYTSVAGYHHPVTAINVVTGSADITYPTGLYTITNQAALQQDTTAWLTMPAVTVNDGWITPGGEIYHAVSFDEGVNYKAFKAAAWLTIAKLDTVWKYWTGAAYAASTKDTALYALRQAMAVGAGNQWNSTEIAAMNNADWTAAGGLDVGVTTTLDWAAGFLLESTNYPFFTSVSVTHTQTDNAVTEEYHTAGAWTAGDGFTNNTKTGAISFAQTGTIMYDTAAGYTADYYTLNEVPGYWFRLKTNGTSSATAITRILYKAPCQALSSIGSGQPDICSGFIYQQMSSGGIEDYTVNVGDNVKTSLSKADLPMSSSDYIYIGYYTKFGAIEIEPYLDNNTNVSTLSAQYWNGLAWTAVAITDGTTVGGCTIAGKGKVSFTAPTDWMMCIPPLPGSPRFPRVYWVRLRVSATLSAATAISEVRIYPTPEPLVKHKIAVALNDRVAIMSRPDARDQIAISGSMAEYLWTGPDTAAYRIGGMDAIQCAITAWNGLMLGKTETWHQLKGGSPLDFNFEAVEAARHVPINSQCIIKAPAGGFDSGDKYALMFLNRYGCFISTGLHTDSLWNSSQGKTISEALNWWDTNAAPRLDLDYLHVCCGAYWPAKNWAVWSVPMITAGSGPQTTNNRLIVFDLTIQAWLPPFTIAAASLCTAYHYSATGPQKLGDLGLYAGTYDGSILRLFDKATTTDSGNDIAAYIETGWLHFDAPEIEKLIRNMFLYGHTTGTNITIEIYRDGSTSLLSGDTLTTTALTNPTAKLFTDDFRNSNIYSNYFKFKISFTGPTSIYAMQLNMEPIRDWPAT